MIVRRDHAIAVSVDAVAASWARTEHAPHGAVVVVGQEISPRGRNGGLWEVEPEQTVALAIVVRPGLDPAEADALWLAVGLAVVDAIESVGGRFGSARWPDAVTVDDRTEMAAYNISTQLGPGVIRAATLAIRVDLTVARLPLRARADLVEQLHDRVLARIAEVESDPDAIAARYAQISVLRSRSIKVRLLPNGTARGIAQGFSSSGAILIGATPDVCEAIAVDVVGSIQIIERDR